MKQYAVVHGRTVEKRGHRYFAIPKLPDNAQQAHEKTNIRGNWERIERQPRGSRLIINHHR